MRSSTTARILQDAIFKAVGRYDGASFEDVKNYVDMRVPNRMNDRTILRHVRKLVDAGVIAREGANNHFTYKLAQTT